MLRRLTVLFVSLVLMCSALLVSDAGVSPFAGSAASAATIGPLHTTGSDGLIYDAVESAGAARRVQLDGDRSRWAERQPEDRRRVRRGLAHARGPDGQPPDDLRQHVPGAPGLGLQRHPGADLVEQPRAGRARMERERRQLRPHVEPDVLERPQVDGHECARQWAHGDPRHAPGLLVAGAAPHHELERHLRVLRGCRPAAAGCIPRWMPRPARHSSSTSTTG